MNVRQRMEGVTTSVRMSRAVDVVPATKVSRCLAIVKHALVSIVSVLYRLNITEHFTEC